MPTQLIESLQQCGRAWLGDLRARAHLAERISRNWQDSYGSTPLGELLPDLLVIDPMRLVMVAPSVCKFDTAEVPFNRSLARHVDNKLGVSLGEATVPLRNCIAEVVMGEMRRCDGRFLAIENMISPSDLGRNPIKTVPADSIRVYGQHVYYDIDPIAITAAALGKVLLDASVLSAAFFIYARRGASVRPILSGVSVYDGDGWMLCLYE